MNALRRHVLQPILDLWSLVVGLKVTGGYFSRKLITVHYPRQVIDSDNLATYGGHIELIGRADDPATPRCISCMLCMINCPSRCLTVVKQKPPKLYEEQEKTPKPKVPKNPRKYLYDYSLCSLCGTCIDVCPVHSLRFSNNIYWAATSRAEMKLDLLARLKARTVAGTRAAEGNAVKPARAKPVET